MNYIKNSSVRILESGEAGDRGEIVVSVVSN